MSWLRHRDDNAKPDYTGLQLQTSVSTLPIPIALGPEQAAPGTSSGMRTFRPSGRRGGEGRGRQGRRSRRRRRGDQLHLHRRHHHGAVRRADLAASAIVWNDQSIYTLSDLGFGSVRRARRRRRSGPISRSLYPEQALAYQGTAYRRRGRITTSARRRRSATINFEIIGVFAGTGANGVDADPALVIYDFLTNAQYGAGFDPASIDATTLFGSGGDASLQTYCKAMGIAFSPVLASQEQGLEHPDALAADLSIAPRCGAAASASSSPTATAPISAGAADDVPGAILDPHAGPAVDAATPPADRRPLRAGELRLRRRRGLCVHGRCVRLHRRTSRRTVAGTYGMSPSGTYVFASGDEGTAVVITYTYAAATVLRPEPDAGLRPDRSRFRRREGQQGSGAGRARRRVLAADDPAHRVSRRAATNMRSMPVEARDQSADRALRAARRLDDPGA